MLHTLYPLKSHRSSINVREIAPAIKHALAHISTSPHWQPFVADLRALRDTCSTKTLVDTSSKTISIRFSDGAQPKNLESLAQAILPWRVGPYQIGDFTIDAEWRSFMKWNRIAPLLGDLTDKTIADVGCSNGYFLFKMLDKNPELLVGFDPVERCWLQFAFLQELIRAPNVGFVPTGIATLPSFPDFFDTVICMGVIYHQRDPFTACKNLFACTKPGGTVILESLVIDRSDSSMLIPSSRYAKMRNAWLIPTAPALESLMQRAGFQKTEVHSFGALSTDEQRSTPWAPYESLADFLDPTDRSKTIEGYPAPHTALVVAKKLAP